VVKKISLFSLVMLIVASIDSVRNLPVAALFGSALIFVFIASAIIFLIPTGLVAAELTATYPEKGGVYHWVHEAFGEKLAMVAIWMQWINTMVWYPTTLAFIAGTAAYLIHPDLAEHKGYLIGASLAVFWFITLINFSGLHFSSWISSICGIIGTVCPLLFLAVLGAAWVFTGQPLQISINMETLIPSFADSTSWISIIAVMSSFLGMELAGVHVNDIKNPQKNFPRAVFLSSLFILVTMILGSLAIALVLPSNQINFVSGVMQVLFSLFEVFHLSWLMPVLTILVVIGTIGSIINWLISPAKGLLHAAEYRYLPPFFTKKNSRGVPVNILLMQGVLVSLLCFVFFLVPSVNAFYWFLVTLSTELYMVMYVLMFLAAIKLHYKFKNRPLVFKIPGKSFGMWVTGVLGILGSFATIVVSFFPPPNIEIGSKKSYIGMMVIANILAISPVFLFYFYKKWKEKKAL
jgi:amino acid transporter